MLPMLPLFLLAATGCQCAPLAVAGDTSARFQEPTFLRSELRTEGSPVPSSLSSHAISSRDTVNNRRLIVANELKGDVAREERPSIAIPLLGAAFGTSIVALGIFCANSNMVRNAFSTKPENGHEASVITGTGITLGGVGIIAVSLVVLKQAW